MTLYRITAPHFVAGVLIEDGVVRDAAPILKRSVGRSLAHLEGFCAARNWGIEKVGSHGHDGGASPRAKRAQAPA